jgi:hypothetical protein
MGILRLFNQSKNSEIILLAVAYLTKVRLNSQNQLHLIPEDNMYKYLYVHGHLWVDLVTPDRINTPLIGLLDVESPKPHIDSISESKKHRFLIHYPFFRDSTIPAFKQANQKFQILVNNLFQCIPLPNDTELMLFHAFSNNIFVSEDEIQVENNNLPDEDDIEIDIEII